MSNLGHVDLFAVEYLGLRLHRLVMNLLLRSWDVQSVLGNQVKTVDIKDIKKIMPVDRVINEIPDYTKYGRKSKLDLDPAKIPDLNWILTTRTHTHTTPTTTISLPSQTVTVTPITMPIVSLAVITDSKN